MDVPNRVASSQLPNTDHAHCQHWQMNHHHQNDKRKYTKNVINFRAFLFILSCHFSIGSANANANTYAIRFGTYKLYGVDGIHGNTINRLRPIQQRWGALTSRSCNNIDLKRFVSGSNPCSKCPKLISTMNVLRTLRGGAVDQPKSLPTPPSSSSSPPSPYDYTPITALDDYGQSAQLRHAMESAARFGTPVIACLCCSYPDDNVAHGYGNGGGDNTVKEAGNRMENTILVCSLQRPRLGVISSSHSLGDAASTRQIRQRSSGAAHPSIQGMVRILATRDDCTPPPPSIQSNQSHQSDHTDHTDQATTQSLSQSTPLRHSLHTAIVTTGIQSDAQFLLSQLQSHFISWYWFRYDTLPCTAITLPSSSSSSSSSIHAAVKMVRDVLLDCLGYDWGEEVGSAQVSGGIGSAAPSSKGNGGGGGGDDDDEGGGGGVRAGRPLGICTFLLGLDTSTSQIPPTLTVIQANGSSEQYVAHAMGMGSTRANELLAQKWTRGMSEVEAREMMRGVLREVALEKGWLENEDEVKDNGNIGGDEDTESLGGGKDVDLSQDKVSNHGLTVVCESVSCRGVDVEYCPL